jgi:flagellar basal-body rod modification protein FlgD
MTGSVAGSTMPASVVSLPSSDQLPSSANGTNAANANLNENDFFQLLTAQLDHQDPLNPMSAADFAAELAQFSTAIGVQQLQTSQTSYSNLQLSGLVGHNVAVNGNSLILSQGGSAAGALNLSGPASDVLVTVSDSSGNPVQLLNLGALPAGIQSFSWNGSEASGSTASAGTYTYQAAAVGANGTTVTVTPYAVAPVTSVNLGGSNGPTVDLGGGLSPVGINGIYQVF